jgi:hypothetical protein
MDVDYYVPGHGHVCSKKDVRDMRDILTFIEDTARKAYAEGERDPIALAYKTQIPEKWENYGEQERLVMNFITFWKEVDPSYKEPEFFELMCLAGEYHKHLNQTRGYTR